MDHLMIEFSNKVAEALDGGLIPWRLHAAPRNVLTNKLYGGVNPILLNIAATRLNLSSPYWGTHEQWKAVGCKVRQLDIEEWGARIILLKENKSTKARSITSHRLVRDVVYNWAQTDRALRPPELPEPNPEEGFQAIIKNGGVKIEYAFNQDCKYYEAEDLIRMPHRSMFEYGPGGLSGFYDALGHEIFHWSESRMHWDGSADVNELRAEIGTGYLGAILGAKPLPPHLARHHRKHAGRWASLMRADPEMLFKVCENVTDTVTYFLKFAGWVVPWYVVVNDSEEQACKAIHELIDYLYEPQGPDETPEQVIQKLRTWLQRLGEQKGALKPVFEQMMDRISKQPRINKKEDIIIFFVGNFLEEESSQPS